MAPAELKKGREEGESIMYDMIKNLGLSKSFPGGSGVCLQCGTPGFEPWVGKIPWRRKWQSTPVLLPGKSHGQGSLGRLQSMGSQSWTRLSNFTFTFMLRYDVR